VQRRALRLTRLKSVSKTSTRSLPGTNVWECSDSVYLLTLSGAELAKQLLDTVLLLPDVGLCSGARAPALQALLVMR